MSAYIETAPTRAEVDAFTGATVIQFGTNWCGYCMAAEPHIAAAMAQHPETLANAAHAAWNCGRPKAASDLADLVESFGGETIQDVIRVASNDGVAMGATHTAAAQS